MAKVFLLLGSNLGDRELNISSAEKLIEQHFGKFLKSSSVYETEPWGIVSEKWFLNKVLIVETRLKPLSILKKVKAIEQKLGRKVDLKKYAPRIIDIDILFIDQMVLELQDFIVPHPLISERKFTLVPLFEIASGFVHPVSGKSISQLIIECKDNLIVKNYNSTYK